MTMLAYVFTFGTIILTYKETTIPLIGKAVIYGSAITVAHIVCRGVWRKYHSKTIVAVLIAGAVLMSMIWTLPNITQQTNREVILGHVGLSAAVIILCGFVLLTRWGFMKMFGNKSGDPR